MQQYYHLFELNLKRVEGFNNKNIIDKIKGRVLENESITSLKERVWKELLTDKLYLQMLDSFLHQGAIKHPNLYTKLEELPHDPRKKMSARDDVKAVNDRLREDEERKAKDKPSRFADLKELEKKYLRSKSNNGSFDEETNNILSHRRNYHIDTTVWAREKPTCVHIRIDKTGVMEGLKSRDQYLGKKDQDLYVPLRDSRIPL